MAWGPCLRIDPYPVTPCLPPPYGWLYRGGKDRTQHLLVKRQSSGPFFWSTVATSKVTKGTLTGEEGSKTTTSCREGCLQSLKNRFIPSSLTSGFQASKLSLSGTFRAVNTTKKENPQKTPTLFGFRHFMNLASVHLSWGWLEGEVLTRGQSSRLLISPICPWFNLVLIFKTQMRVDPLTKFTNCCLSHWVWRISLCNLAPDEAVGPWIQLASHFCASLCGLRQFGRPRPGWLSIVPASSRRTGPRQSLQFISVSYFRLFGPSLCVSSQKPMSLKKIKWVGHQGDRLISSGGGPETRQHICVWRLSNSTL